MSLCETTVEKTTLPGASLSIDRCLDEVNLLGVLPGDLSEPIASSLIQSLTGRTLLLKALERSNLKHGPLVYSYGKNGKPSLADYPDFHFNISHCSQAVVCVYGREELGVDVEAIDSRNLDLLETVLNPSEVNDVRCSRDPARTFCRYWTKKESLLKYTGEGISGDLQNLLQEVADVEFIQISEKEYEICVCRKRRPVNIQKIRHD